MERISFFNSIGNFFTRNYKPAFVIYLLATLISSIQALLLPGREMPDFEGLAVFYNNYIIFKYSFFHLLDGQNLYTFFPSEHYDLYKYSPTFALLFGMFSIMPDSIGLILWNLLNAFCLFYAIKQLPVFDDRRKILMLLFVALEMVTSIQSAQSNALIAGLILMGFTMLEKKNYFLAVLFITSTVYIKLFGLVAFAILLFYPNKPKLIAYSIFWFVVLALLPLVVVPFSELTSQYSNWLTVLQNDHDTNQGTSLLGFLEYSFHLGLNKTIVVLVGVVIFLICLIRINMYKVFQFRLLTLASVLIWVIIFNHRAESMTFVIAVTGVALWYFSQERTTINITLLWLVFVFTSLSPTDIFPNYIQDNFFEKYMIKAVPCILVWIKIIYDVFILKLPENKILDVKA